MREFFKDIPKIQYEGKDSKNPLAFKYYNPDEVVGDKTMKEHLRFSMAFWHTFTGTGSDPFGTGTMLRPWENTSNAMELAKARVRAAFEFNEKLGMPFFCFHDRDIAPEGNTLAETNKNLDEIVSLIKELMQQSNIKLLWGTANLFSNPRFVHGAATSCNANVFAYAAAQVKKAMEVTKELGGENYVFWGGREGYETLLNTDMGLELDNLARFFHMAVDYAKEIGFTGQFLIEPKPKEPTKHQYDFDVATVLGFLRKYGLDKYFKMNIEANHATLAGHTFQHELHFARINGVLGSVDANQGDMLLGWDTDQFPTDIYTTTLAMYEILKNGGLHSGGLNFDSKVRRASFEPVDLFYAHIAGMDAFARGLKVAYKLLESKELENFVAERYSSYREGIGKDIVEGKVGFKELEKYALENSQIKNTSGRQEMLETILNQYILEV
ncbi:xylose isomerase [Petroclostridium xylanilyticum]|uniref:xylose isomerase n=1 Tax=Petroclostridium xylanilyticum TaxID=1792311 RepID=UPI000B9806F2|nr:xylose isomerase [Petroclostridium xylanilyticum]